MYHACYYITQDASENILQKVKLSSENYSKTAMLETCSKQKFLNMSLKGDSECF